MAPIITVKDLRKHFRVSLRAKGFAGTVRSLLKPQYRLVRAVDGISFDVQPGELLGYLGPNGAGKSTTIKLLTGILHPSAGQVEVNGLVPQRERKRNAYNIGVVFGQRSQLGWDMPLVDTFDFLAAMYRVPPARYRAQRDLLVELLDMGSFLRQSVRLLSLGQRMRGEIAAALLHEPPLLYLDEPTVGLDILAKNRVLQFLKDLNAEKGTTILLTTHNLSDVEQVCPRIVILDRGKVRLDMPRAELLRRFGRRRVLVVRFEDCARDLNLARGKVIRAEENELWIEFDREEVSAFDLIAGLERDKGILDVSIQEETIESIVARLYQGQPEGRP